MKPSTVPTEYAIPKTMKALGARQSGGAGAGRKAGARNPARRRCWCGSMRSRRSAANRHRDPQARALPAMIDGEAAVQKPRPSPPGHEYMGTIVRPSGPTVGRVPRSVTASQSRCMPGAAPPARAAARALYINLLMPFNYGLAARKGHRAPMASAAFAEYAVNHNVNTMVHVPGRYERRRGDIDRHLRHTSDVMGPRM